MKSTGMPASAGGSTGADHADTAWTRSRHDDDRTAARRRARAQCTAFSWETMAQDGRAAGRILVTGFVPLRGFPAMAAAGQPAGRGYLPVRLWQGPCL